MPLLKSQPCLRRAMSLDFSVTESFHGRDREWAQRLEAVVVDYETQIGKLQSELRRVKREKKQLEMQSNPSEESAALRRRVSELEMECDRLSVGNNSRDSSANLIKLCQAETRRADDADATVERLVPKLRALSNQLDALRSQWGITEQLNINCSNNLKDLEKWSGNIAAMAVSADDGILLLKRQCVDLRRDLDRAIIHAITPEKPRDSHSVTSQIATLKGELNTFKSLNESLERSEAEHIRQLSESSERLCQAWEEGEELRSLLAEAKAELLARSEKISLLSSQVEKAKHENAQLSSDLASSRTNWSSTNKAAAQAQEELARERSKLRQLLSESEREVARLADDIRVKERAFADIEMELRLTRADRDSLRVAKDGLSSAHKESDSRVKLIALERDEARDVVNDLKHRLLEDRLIRERLESEVNGLRCDLRESRQDVARLSTELDELEVRGKEGGRHKSEMETEFELTKRRAVEASEQNEELGRKLDQSERRERQLSESLDSVQAALDGERARLVQTELREKQASDSLRAKSESLAALLEQKTAKEAELVPALAALRYEKQNLEERLNSTLSECVTTQAALEDVKAEIEALTHARQQLSTQLQMVERDRQELRNEGDALRTQLHNALDRSSAIAAAEGSERLKVEALSRELEATKSSMADMEEALFKVSGKRDRLEEKIALLQTDLEAKNDRVRMVEAQEAEARVLVSAITAKLDSQVAVETKLDHRCHDLETRLRLVSEERKDEVAAAAMRTDAIQQRAVEAEKALAVAAAQLSAMRANEQALQEQIEDIHNELNRYKIIGSDKSSRLHEVTERLNREVTRGDVAEGAVREMRLQVAGLEAAVAEMRDAEREARADYKILSANYEAMCSSKAALTAALNNEKGRAADAESRVHALMVTVTEAKDTTMEMYVERDRADADNAALKSRLGAMEKLANERAAELAIAREEAGREIRRNKELSSRLKVSITEQDRLTQQLEEAKVACSKFSLRAKTAEDEADRLMSASQAATADLMATKRLVDDSMKLNETIRHDEHDVVAKDATIRTLRDRMVELETTLRFTEQQAAQTAESLTKVEASEASCVACIDKLRQRCEELKQTMENERRLANEAQVACTAAEERAKWAEARLVHLEVEVRDTSEMLMGATKRAATAESASQVVYDLQATKEQLTTKLAASERFSAELRTLVTDSEERVARLERDNKDLQSQLVALNDRLRSAVERCSDANTEAETARRTILKLNDELNLDRNEIKNLKSAQVSLSYERDALAKSANDVSMLKAEVAEVGEVRRRLSDLKHINDRLSDDLLIRDREISELKRTEIEGRNLVTQLESRCSSAKEQCELHRRKAEALQRRVTELQTRLDSVKSEWEVSDDSERQVRRQLMSAEAENRRLQDQLVTVRAEADLAQKALSASRSDMLERSLNGSDGPRSEGRSLESELRAWIGDLEFRLQTERSRCMELSSQLHAAREQVTILQSSNDRLKSQNDKTMVASGGDNTDSPSIVQGSSSLHRALMDLQKRVAAALRDDAQGKVWMEAVHLAVDELQRKANGLQERLDISSASLQEVTLRQQLKDLEPPPSPSLSPSPSSPTNLSSQYDKERAALRRRVASLEAQVMKLENEARVTTELNRQLQSQLSQSKAEVALLSKEMKELERLSIELGQSELSVSKIDQSKKDSSSSSNNNNREDVTQWVVRCNELTVENEGLKAVLKARSSSTDARDGASDEGRWRVQAQRLEAELEACQADNERLRAKISTLREELEEKSKGYSAGLAVGTDMASALRSFLDAETQRADDLEMELSDARALISELRGGAPTRSRHSAGSSHSAGGGGGSGVGRGGGGGGGGNGSSTSGGNRHSNLSLTDLTRY